MTTESNALVATAFDKDENRVVMDAMLPEQYASRVASNMARSETATRSKSEMAEEWERMNHLA